MRRRRGRRELPPAARGGTGDANRSSRRAASKQSGRRSGGWRTAAPATRGPAKAFEAIRRGADGRLKIQAQGRRRWSRRKEELFFAVLRECGNIAASARAAGVSREAVWKRRREWPAFARRFGEALDEAEIILEFRIACHGTNWAEIGGFEEEEEAPPPRDGQSSSPANAGEEQQVPFDPELAMRFLKWRRDERGGRRGAAAALPPAEEVRERILRKVAAIQRHKALAARRRDEEGGE